MNMELEWLRRGVPRPLMYRKDPVLLDGEWMLNGQPVNVPFPPESKAAEWQGKDTGLYHYEKVFSFTPDAACPRTFLHFGAVDQVARVSVNGNAVCVHEGGYLPFSVEITRFVRAGVNLLTVDAQDSLSSTYPYGKQSLKPHGMWYTKVSGIWQSVFMESVPERFVEEIRIRSDMTGIDLFIRTESTRAARAFINGRDHLLSTNQWVRIMIDHPHLWSPEDPYLYPMRIKVETDIVNSYFALRTIDIATHNGRSVVCLNGQPIYLHGLLDQGYFPDGIFTPNHMKQFETDILNARALGYNCLRKHIKVEHEAFYAYCDLYGMLVLQDMVNSGPYHYIRDTVLPNIGIRVHTDRTSPAGDRDTFFIKHCQDTVHHLLNHPCVIGYCIFNEGWGQFMTSQIYEMLKGEDPSRFYISASGWYQGYRTDVDSDHVYFRNKVLKARTRPMMLTECGGFPCDLGGHSGRQAYGYGRDGGPDMLMRRIREMTERMILPSIRNGLNGCIYTQLTDVEGEINGLFSYDRSVCKVSADLMQALAAQCRQVFDEASR